MTWPTEAVLAMWTGDRLGRVGDHVAAVRAATADLFARELTGSTGHLAAVLHGCLFAPSLLTFWLVNGVLDFSTALVLGTVASPAGLGLRLLAYVLLVPAFLLARATVHLLHPTHRAQVLAGSCPELRLLSLDWFSVGVLATGLPLALQNLGPWLGTNAVVLAGVFVLPRPLAPRRARAVRLLAVAGGAALFLYATYGAALPLRPRPATVLGPVATATLAPDATAWLLRLVNSVVFGPPLVAAFGAVTNRVLTRPELADLPLVRHTLPRRDPDRVVVTSATLGTVVYLAVVAAATGRVVVLP
ncbi:MAG: hypothetical protein V5A31_12145 [Haloferacaceae archaeon]